MQSICLQLSVITCFWIHLNLIIHNCQLSLLTSSAGQLALNLGRPSTFTSGESSWKQKKADISDVDPFNFGQFVSVASIDDDTKLNLINNHWKPTKSFSFPCLSLRQEFCLTWLDPWSWLCHSYVFNGTFCLSCILFGKKTGHNGSKLKKLFKEQLTNWQSAASKLEQH